MGALGVVAALAGATQLATGDTVFNDVKSNNGLGQILEGTTGAPAATKYWVDASGGGPDCDPADTTPATITVEAPAGVTASPASFEVTTCSSDGGLTNAVSVELTACKAGDYDVPISVGDDDADDKYTIGQATLKLRVTGEDTDCGGGGGGSSITPPDVTLTSVSPATWTNQPVDVVWTIDDGGDPNATFSDDCGTSNGDGTYTKTVTAESADATGTALTCEVTNEAGSDSDGAVVYIDLTDPLISGAPTAGPDGNNGWYVSDVTIHWTCSDALSGLVDVTGCPADDTISADGADQTVDGTAYDNAGNDATATSDPAVDVDQTDPAVVLSGIAEGANVATGTTATCAVTDLTSGPVNAAPAAAYSVVSDPDGDGLGAMRATCSGEDMAGNTASTSVDYNTTSYGTGGSNGNCLILQPILCDTLNLFSRGKSVPTKFKLAGDGAGTPYPNGFNTTAWKMSRVSTACVVGSEGIDDQVSTQNSQASTYIRYDAPGDQYVWNADFKDKAVGSCWKMRVDLLPSATSGSSAVFRLQK